MLKFKLTSGRPSFTEGATFTFKSLSGHEDLRFTNEKYTLGDDGIELEYAIEITNDGNTKATVCWHPLGETAYVILPRLSKRMQRNVLNDRIRELNLGFQLHTIEEVDVDTSEGQFELEEKSLLKPLLGSNSIGIVLMDAGTHDVSTYHNLAKGLHLIHCPEDARNVESIIGNGFTHEKYIDNIVDEYRLVMFADGEHYICKRATIKNSQGVSLPKAQARAVSQFNQYALPEDVLVDLERLIAALDIYGYSIDLYRTADNKWGIFEYSPEYALKSATPELADKINEKSLSHYLDRLPPKSNTINAHALIIRTWREELGYSSLDVAVRLGMSMSDYLDRFENLHVETNWDLLDPLLHILGRKKHELEDMSAAAHRKINGLERSSFRKAKIEAKVNHLLMGYLSDNESLIDHLQSTRKRK